MSDQAFRIRHGFLCQGRRQFPFQGQLARIVLGAIRAYDQIVACDQHSPALLRPHRGAICTCHDALTACALLEAWGDEAPDDGRNW